MTDFHIKRGDTLPPLQMTLSDSEGVIDLTNVTTVKLLARAPSGVIVEREFDVDSPATGGNITYEFVAEDWEADGFVPGFWTTEVELTYADGSILTIPTIGQKTMQVEGDLA